MLKLENILKNLKTEYIGREIICKRAVDSTNVQIKKYAEVQNADGLVLIAEEQKAGRGRRGRSWSSPAGDSIYMSLLLKPELRPESASMLTLVAALAVSAAITDMTGFEVKIKWPNDIVIGKRKICGILTEMSAELNHIHYVIVGIGINVNTKSFPDEIGDIASSLYLVSEKKQTFSRSQLICAVLEQFEAQYFTFLKEGNLEFAMESYNRRLAGYGGEVKLLGENAETTGISKGITKTGELLVEFSDGSRKEVRSGEVSVRGLYGYV